jgi:hypothetical protein
MSDLSIIELDTLRADTMRAFLNEEGQREIWKYDIVSTRAALAEAVDRDDYDNQQAGCDAHRAGKGFALIGAGIMDHHFSTPEELISILRWLCVDGGYLSSYARAAEVAPC